MFLDSVGIILRKNESSPHKMVILDKRNGKIEGIVASSSHSAGALIAYTLRQQRNTNFISDSTLIYLPLSLAQNDMLFFHHVLELIYYFTHIGNCSEEVFNLLAFLYSTEYTQMTMQFKKFFLLKLLMSTGSMPDLPHIHSERIAYLNTIDIKKLQHITIDNAYEKELDRWLWCCIWQHPYVNEFKTVHFLAENRIL